MLSTVASRVVLGSLLGALAVSAQECFETVLWQGRLFIQNTTNGEPLGYVKNYPTEFNGINHGDFHGELHVGITTVGESCGPVDIIATNAEFPAPYYVGISGSVENAFINIGSANYLNFTPVSRSVQDASPDAQYGESTVWTFENATGLLTAQWVNPDVNKVPALMIYEPTNNELFFVGDVEAYNAANPDLPVWQVTMFLVQDVCPMFTEADALAGASPASSASSVVAAPPTDTPAVSTPADSNPGDSTPADSTTTPATPATTTPATTTPATGNGPAAEGPDTTADT